MYDERLIWQIKKTILPNQTETLYQCEWILPYVRTKNILWNMFFIEHAYINL